MKPVKIKNLLLYHTLCAYHNAEFYYFAHSVC